MTQLFTLNPIKFSNRFIVKKNPPLLINDKFVTNIKTKGNIFNKLFAEQCISLKNDSFLPTSQNILKTIKTALN